MPTRGGARVVQVGLWGPSSEPFAGLTKHAAAYVCAGGEDSLFAGKKGKDPEVKAFGG